MCSFFTHKISFLVCTILFAFWVVIEDCDQGNLRWSRYETKSESSHDTRNNTPAASLRVSLSSFFLRDREKIDMSKIQVSSLRSMAGHATGAPAIFCEPIARRHDSDSLISSNKYSCTVLSASRVLNNTNLITSQAWAGETRGTVFATFEQLSQGLVMPSLEFPGAEDMVSDDNPCVKSAGLTGAQPLEEVQSLIADESIKPMR